MYYIPIQCSDFTLLIQGRYHVNTLLNIQSNKDCFKNIIVSTWKEGFDDKDRNHFYQNANLLINTSPNTDGIHNVSNIYYQTCSTLNGLSEVKTKFVVKVRSDEYWSNLNLMVNKFEKSKLLSSNVFFRNIEYCPYHISDHLFAGETAILLSTFQNMKKYFDNKNDIYGILNNSTPPEKIFTLFYLQARGYHIKNLLDTQKNLRLVYQIMTKEFDVFDVKDLMPYGIMASAVGKIDDLEAFIANDIVLQLCAVNSIEDIKLGLTEKIYMFIKRCGNYLRKLIKRAKAKIDLIC
jgi:hypothetical protein